MTANEHYIVLGSDEGVILIDGANADPWEASTLVAIQPRDEAGSTLRNTGYDDWGAERNQIWILTGDQWGPFAVTARALLSAPDEADDEWEDVTESSVSIYDGLHITDLVDQQDGIVLDLPSGTYRLRVCAKGRTSAALEGDTDEPGKESERGNRPVEHYLIELWPTPEHASPVDVRETSPFARAARAEPAPEPMVEEAGAGLAAAARIGVDVDGRPGCRILTGATGVVTVSREMFGTRRRLFKYLRSGVPLSRHVPSWSFISGNDWDQVGAATYTATNDVHPDQLSGSRAIIRNVSVEETPPVRLVRRTAWLVRPADQDTGPIRDRVPLFEPDTTVTITYHDVKDEYGHSRTTVTVHHADLPMEWVEDMRAWWAYQLAVLQAEFDSHT